MKKRTEGKVKEKLRKKKKEIEKIKQKNREWGRGRKYGIRGNER